MYRFVIGQEEWILRFSPQLLIEREEKDAIISSLLQIGSEVTNLSHGNSFILFLEGSGAIVFDVERIPSLILTISTIVPEDQWYKKK